MSEIFRVLAYPTIVSLYFLLGEIILWLAFDIKGGWKFRFSGVEGYPNLRPYAKTWKLALVFILIVIVIIPILNAIFWEIIINFFEKLGGYLILLLVITLSLVYIWTTKLIMNRKWNISDLIPVTLIIGTTAITLLIKYYF